MEPTRSGRRSILGGALIGSAVGLLSVPSRAAEEPAYFVRPVAELKLKKLPAGPLYWRVESFPKLSDAQAAAGPASLTAEIAGKVWLFTLGAKRAAPSGGSYPVEIGPVPDVTAPEYLLRINYAGGAPGAKTAVHTHPGSETFYVLTGQLVQKSSHGEARVDAGQAMAGHAPGIAMEVSSGGTGDLTALVMFVVDATKPFSAPAEFE